MAACIFFGHRSTDTTYAKVLAQQIEFLICNYGVDTFYVGNQGNFDFMVLCALREMQSKYSYIQYFVVLAYMPGKKQKEEENIKYYETIYPDGLETVPRRFAISFRNKWMIQHSEYVIACVYYSSSGAGQFVRYAKNKKKTVINLTELSK